MGMHHPRFLLLVFVIYFCKVNVASHSIGNTSKFRELPCPNPEDITPCICTYDIEDEVMDMDCSSITGEQELYDVFHADLPIPIFRKLSLGTRYLTQLSDDVFGEATFVRIDVNPGVNGMIHSVGPKTFLNSVYTLEAIFLDNNQITEFPFETLNQYEKLNTLSLTQNPLPSFPVIECETLRVLRISDALWHDIPAGAFDGIPNLAVLHMSNNRIDSLPKGVFSSLPNLSELLMFNNGLERLESLQFSVNSDDLYVISLANSFIESVEPDTFKGYHSGLIVLSNNKLTVLPEDTWRPVLEAGIKQVRLDGNDLTCGCDIAWLVLEPSFHSLVEDAQCHSGEMLINLDPNFYENNC